ncbi:MAG: hypothetical protein Fur0018_20510 [Anaerolineales bacterium]
MRTVRHSQSSPPENPQPPDSGPPSPTAFGCVFLFPLAFIAGGLWMLWAIFGGMPRETFEGVPGFIIVVGGLAFLTVGVYLLIVFIRAAAGLPSISGRVFADIILFLIAIPFNYWLFFGKAAGGAAAGTTAPGGIAIFLPLPPIVSLIVKKTVVGLVCLVVDLLLVSEIFGLGWFAWTSGGGGRVLNAECRMRNAEWRMQNGECRMETTDPGQQTMDDG